MSLVVCYVVSQYPKVSHSFIRREILALEDLGVEVERVSVRGWDLELADEDDVRERGKTVYLLKKGALGLLAAGLRTCVRTPARFLSALALTLRTGWRSHRPLPVHLVYLLEACALAEHVGRRKVDHFHAHFGTNSADVAMLAHVLTGIPYSFTAHGPDEFDQPKGLNLPEKIARAAFVVAITSFARGQLARWCRPGDEDKLVIVRCGLDRTFLEPPPASPYPARIVCVGRFCVEKGQVMLVEAAATLAREGRVFELVLVGDGDTRPQVEAAIAANGLQASVRLTGWADASAVRQEILAARALALPSLAEGLPVVIMESLALCRPVLTTYIAGIPELVRDGREGWLFPSGSPHHLAEALRKCLDTPEDEVAAMGRSGRARVLERHDVAQEAARLEQHFRRFAKGEFVQTVSAQVGAPA